jgi:surfactin synthase thioesterase subunit
MKLFLLPFAGGSRYAYWNYGKHAPQSLEVCPIELPGRGTRVKEPLLTDINMVVADIYQQIATQLEEPYALYGHSMGALLCYLLTLKIRAAGLRLPEHLFLTGCDAPRVPEERGYYKLPIAAFKNKLREMGGCPEDVLNSEELFSFYEPIIRADFMVVDSFKYTPVALLDIPITVMVGTEEKITAEDVGKWQEETLGAIEIHHFPGNHFFIFNYEKEIMEIVTKKLKTRLNEKRISIP